LFARWVSNWDCGFDTGFYCEILDHHFNIDALKAKRRYEINYGNKFFYTRQISCDEVEMMYDAYLGSLAGYKNAKTEDKESFCKGWKYEIEKKQVALIGVFHKEDGVLCGYAHCIDHGKYIPISSFKTMVTEEKNRVNHALMNGVCEYYKEKLESGSYLCDGYRNVLHETAFQDWLEKYFQFRKAYCQLNIVYRPIVKVVVKILYPIRSLLKHFKKVYALLLMEELARQGKNMTNKSNNKHEY